MNLQRLSNYADIMVRKNLAQFDANIFQGTDFVNDAYAETECEENAIKIIRANIIIEKRRFLAQLQKRSPVDYCGEKKCNGCNEYKPYSDYYQRTDRLTDFQYFDFRCKDCHRKYMTEWRHKNKDKIRAYEQTEHAKQLARERQKRFRTNHKTT